MVHGNSILGWLGPVSRAGAAPPGWGFKLSFVQQSSCCAAVGVGRSFEVSDVHTSVPTALVPILKGPEGSGEAGDMAPCEPHGVQSG